MTLSSKTYTGPFRVWAIDEYGGRSEVRLSTLDRLEAEDKALAVARASSRSHEVSAVSVWIEADGDVLWAAGEKATEGLP